MSHAAIRDIVAHFFRVCMKQQQFPKRYKQKLEKNKPSSEEKSQTFGQAQDKKKKMASCVVGKELSIIQ